MRSVSRFVMRMLVQDALPWVRSRLSWRGVVYVCAAVGWSVEHGKALSSEKFFLGVSMIGRLSGLLLDKNPAQLIVDCNGVGYEVGVPMSTFYNLPATGERVTLLTHMVVREDAQLLYGFGTTQERELFRELIKISGIGARTALAILSGMSVNDLAQAVTLQEVGRLTRIPGIGKKTGERLLLELKGKLGAELGTAPGTEGESSNDVLSALLALGYSEKEALLAIKQVPAGSTVSDGIRQALKSLSKA
jgi:Holliday junction DNA helicase RuvA